MARELISCIKNFPKHIKTAFQNIWRNNVMSISSVFAVTITLLLIGVVGIIAINVEDMTYHVEDSLKIYVKLERDITDEDVTTVQSSIENITHVSSVTFSTKDQELDRLIAGYGEEGSELFESYREDNPLGAAFIIEAADPNEMENISLQIEEIAGVHDVNYGGRTTSDLVDGLEAIRNGGAIFIAGLTILALFMIMNTIKITITSRETEISIMRMVGASNWFIRIPFMLEGVIIGFIGAIVPVIVLYYGYQAIYTSSQGIFFSALFALRPPLPFIYQLSAILAALGSGVGLIGSYLSVRRFLKF